MAQVRKFFPFYTLVAVLGLVVIGFNLPESAAQGVTVPEPHIDDSCGAGKPQHAPEGCGVQQWLGYSETNPAAVAWMALANTGETACTVTITRLELSYLLRRLGRPSTRILLSSGVTGVQQLADGTNGKYWGEYLQDLAPSSTFEIQPNSHAYIHPFGPRVSVPDEAVELKVRFAADLTEGCVVAGGLDTYQEDADPTTEAPYTQNGSETDFIKEAYKSPWITESIDPLKPVSFSIKRKSWKERVGWYK